MIGYGSEANPYRESPFDRIVEVGWGGGPIVLVETSQLIDISIIDPNPSTGGGNLYAPNATVPKSDIVQSTIWRPASNIPRLKWPDRPFFFRGSSFFIGSLVGSTHLVDHPHSFPEPVPIPIPFPKPWTDLGVFADWHITGVNGYNGFRDQLLSNPPYDPWLAQFGGQIYETFTNPDQRLGPPTNWHLVWIFRADIDGSQFVDQGPGADGGGITDTRQGNINIYIGQLKEYYSIEKQYILINMSSGEHKAITAALIQGAVTEPSRYPNLGFFPQTILKAYNGGEFVVASDYSSISNVGGTVAWERTITPHAFSGSNQELLRFNKSGPV